MHPSISGVGPAGQADAIVTVPNLLSAARLAGVPVFLWLLLGPHADGWALLVLAVSGFTDWADGVLARRLNQMSSLGAVLDPLVDRLYILATLAGLVLRHIIPPWLAAVIVCRDLILLATLPALRRRGLNALPVHYLGKAATFNLLYAIPLLLLGSHAGTLSEIAKPIAWAFTIWGTALYLWAGGLYLLQVRQITRQLVMARPTAESNHTLPRSIRAPRVQTPPRQPAGSLTMGSHPLISTAMLDELLTNTLDPGYRAAAAGGPRRHWWDGPIVWLGCLAVGLVLVIAYRQSHLSAPARDNARNDLIVRIKALQKTGTTMDATARKLAAEVAALRDAQLPVALNPDLRGLEVASGSIPVHGPGMVVLLGEPPTPEQSGSTGRPGTQPQQQVAVLHDRDIRAVVNELWSAGAEAVAVNGFRLTATSAIRFAGDAVLVDFQTITPPYTIEAVGDRDRMILDFADSAIARQLKTTESVYNISFKFEGRSDLRLSSVTVTEPRFAVNGRAPSPSASGHPSGFGRSGGPSPTKGSPPSSTESPR